MLSIHWSSARGDAWDAANRTFVYAFVLLLFAGWRSSPGARQRLILFFAFGIAVVGVATLFSAAGDVASAFEAERLSAPTGYANATAALFLIPFWAAVSLGGTPRFATPLRSAAVGIAATLAAVAYVPESRGALYSFPVCAALLLLLARNRIRTAIALALAVAPTALLVHPLSRPLEAGSSASRATATHHAAVLAIVCGIGATIAALAAAAIDERLPLKATPRVALAARIAVLACLMVLASVVLLNHPSAEASHLWTSFKSDNNGPATGTTRFGTLGSNRYDFWRVALRLAKDHPVGGVGAGNFGEEYLQYRRTGEQPAYPHSLEMGLLASTGAIGTALFALFVGAAGVSVVRRRRDGSVEAAITAGGATAFAYWLLHGSVDWLWEFPALGIASFLLLGLAIAPYRRPGAPQGVTRVDVLAGAACLVLAGSFVAPWIAARQVAHAADVWRQDPAAAYATLDRAASFNPASDAAPLLAGTIAAERGDVPNMRSSFERAISRDPRNWFSRVQLAVALANESHWQAADDAASIAARLNPREPIVGQIMAMIRRRSRPKPSAVNHAVYRELRQLPGVRR